jgi:hypothetical protein
VLEERPVRPSEGPELLPWNTIFGLQFESMILGNLQSLLDLAAIPSAVVLRAGPYFQNPTKLPGGVQIDCLVQCKRGLLHLFEIKSGKMLGLSVARESAEKTRRLKKPRGCSIRQYLVYLGDLSAELEEGDSFDGMIPIERFLR